MSKSVEDLFRDAPEDATHYAKHCHYKVIGDTWMVHISDNEWVKSDSMYNRQIKPSDIIERPKQPQAWSGPQDGLPPVGQECLFEIQEKKIKVKVFAHRHEPKQKPVALFDVAETGEWGFGEACRFKSIRTQEQLRESAIRDVMDIAQVDCRVTAARLVDAGFKR